MAISKEKHMSVSKSDAVEALRRLFSAKPELERLEEVKHEASVALAQLQNDLKDDARLAAAFFGTRTPFNVSGKLYQLRPTRGPGSAPVLEEVADNGVIKVDI